MKGTKPAMKLAVKPLSNAPPTPDWLPPAALAEWHRVTPILTERKVLTEADLGSLENYCLAIGQVRDCQKTLTALASPFFAGENGAIRPHPAIRVMHTAMTHARQMAAELGLTPVSRSRPAISDEGEENGGFGDLVD